MKKILVMLAALAMTVSLVACTSGPKEKTGGTLVVGTPKLNGDFMDGFGNSSYDNWVRKIINPLGLYAYTPAGEFVENTPFLEKVETSLDDAGNKTYTFTLKSGLKWSDDAPLTAKDYVFTALWNASPEWITAGATSTDGDTFVGYKDYHDGTTKVFAGVKLVDEKTFSYTIMAEELPYFYEFTMVSVVPKPMHVLAPGADVTSTDAGAEITGVSMADATSAVASGYRFAPTVSAGAYKFVSFENDAATLELNPNYPGDYRGEKGKLDKVIVKYVNSTVDVDLVISGDIDLVAGVVEGEKIDKAKNSTTAGETHYSRNGYGYLGMHNDFGPTKDPNVRKAIAFLVDRNEFVTGILGGYGSLVDGQYGLSQWMYQTKKSELEAAIDHYVFNPEKANELLDQTEWKFESNGTTPFDPTKASDTYLRYNAKKEVLQINHFGTTENAVTDLVQVELPKGFAKAGIKFTTEVGDFAKLLDNFYYGYELGADRKYHIFNLATSFNVAFDPYYSSNSCDFVGTWTNALQMCDEELEGYLKAMRRLEPTQKEEYADLWLKYQIRWNQITPDLPLYSNQYYDIFNKRVSGIETTPTYDWADGIVNITVKDAK